MDRWDVTAVVRSLGCGCSRTITLLCVGLLALGGVSAAQSDVGSQGPSVPVVRAETNLVLLDVVVTDKQRAAHGIGKGSFHIFEDGKEQKIVSFEEHRPGEQPAAPKQEPLGPNLYSNRPLYPSTAAVNVLLLDGLNTPLQSQMLARHQMIEYLGKIPAGTPLAIFTLSSQLRLVQGFTSDPAALLAAIKGAKVNSGQSPIVDSGLTAEDRMTTDAAAGAGVGGAGSGSGLSGAETAASIVKQFEDDVAAQQDDARVKMTLHALTVLARYLSGIPGRKNLIWFSGSFPISLDPEKLQNPSAAQIADYSDEVRKTSVQLTSARVAVYPVDARGLMNVSSVDVSIKNAPSRIPTAEAFGGSISTGDQNVLTGIAQDHTSMEELAAETGGRAYLNTNDFKAAVAGAIDHGGSYYTIAYTPAKKVDETYHKLKVQVDGGSYALAYRHGYFTEDRGKGRDKGKGSDKTPQSSLMLQATQRGAPGAAQVLFEARVLPADDQEIVNGPKLAAGPAGELTGSLKGPVKRYVVDSLLDVSTLGYNIDSDGTRQGQVELTLVGYDSNGKRLNFVDRGLAISLKPDLYAKRMQTGLPLRTAIDLPKGEVFLRIAVRDATAEKIGSIEVPLKVVAQ